jgi:hypothetical protein
MEYLDDMFSQFAEAFLGNMEGDGDIAYRTTLNASVLHYSLESLEEVDRYLKTLYKEKISDSGIEYQNVIVWCGAYVGEVIRRNAWMEYHWVHYDEYMKNKEESLKNMIPFGLTTHALLVSVGDDYMTMPMNKIARWLDEGNEHNVYFYAAVDIKRGKDKESAQ